VRKATKRLLSGIEVSSADRNLHALHVTQTHPGPRAKNLEPVARQVESMRSDLKEPRSQFPQPFAYKPCCLGKRSLPVEAQGNRAFDRRFFNADALQHASILFFPDGEHGQNCQRMAANCNVLHGRERIHLHHDV
jgi:hypothetical protein